MRPALIALACGAALALGRLFWKAPQEAPPEPDVLALNAARLRILHAKEDAALKGYSWIDRKAGIGRIPVERAMELMLAKGYPVRPRPASAR